MHRHLRSTSLDISFNPFAEDSKDSFSRRAPPPLNGHSRTRTECTPSNNTHPLKSASLKSLEDITRPSLNRVLNASSSDETSIEDEGEDCDDCETVMVHQVKATDSLAGVALKYGMSMADLRRVNHLWSNDSIYLRQVLYIPLDKASSSSSSQPLQKIPKKELGSFFPPPRKLSPSKMQAPPLAERSVSTPSPSPTPTQPTLATVLSNTAESIISRLSFDSAERTLRRISPSNDSTRKSAGHELHDVSPRPSLDGSLERLRQRSNGPLHGRSVTTWEATPRPLSSSFNMQPTASPSSTSVSPPHSFRTIRTNQLAPEPDMTFPTAMTRPVTSTSGLSSTSTTTNCMKVPVGDLTQKTKNYSTLPGLSAGGGGSKKQRPGLKDENGSLFQTPKVNNVHDGFELE